MENEIYKIQQFIDGLIETLGADKNIFTPEKQISWLKSSRLLVRYSKRLELAILNASIIAKANEFQKRG